MWVPYNAYLHSMIVDAHCHILPPSFAKRHAELSASDATFAALFPEADPTMATVEDLIEAMGLAGVDMAVVMGMGWLSRYTMPHVAL